MKIASSKRGQGGSSLLETVIATSILAILAAGILNCINYGVFIMRLARENSRATQILLEKTEALRLYKWEQVNTPGFVPPSFTALYDPQTPSAPGVVYNGTMTLGDFPFSTSYSTNLRQCTITLQWSTAGRVNHTRTFTTFIAKDGVQNYVY